MEEGSSPSLQSSSSLVQENFVWAAFLASAVASSVVSEDLAIFPACAVGRDFFDFPSLLTGYEMVGAILVQAFRFGGPLNIPLSGYCSKEA